MEDGLQFEVVGLFRARLNGGHRCFDPGQCQRYPVLDGILEQLGLPHIMSTHNRGHARRREGTMGTVWKAALWAVVLDATIKVVAGLRASRKRVTSREDSPARR